MHSAERQAVETVLAKIPREEWNAFLDSPKGSRFAQRLETVRASLRALGEAAQGAPPKPVAETIDLLGHRLLCGHDANPWLRTAILRAMPPGRWRKLRDLYNELRGAHAERCHGNMTQDGAGSEVMGAWWHQGSRWAHAFCKFTGLPAELAARRTVSLPDDEEVLPVEGLPPLHDFQRQVYVRLRALLKDGIGTSSFMSLPTGAGKTRVAVDAICDHLAQTTGNGTRRNLVIWIAQSHELQMQAWDCFRQAWQLPPHSAERPVRRPATLRLIRAWGGRDIDEIEVPHTPAILIAGIDQLASWTERHPDFFEQFPVKRLACVVIDEAHTVVTQESRQVLTALGLRAKHRWHVLQDAPPVIGMSATPWKTSLDGDASLRSFFQRNLLTPRALGRRPIARLQKRRVLSKVRWERLKVRGIRPMTTAQRRHYEQFKDLPGDYLEQLGLEHDRNARILRRLQKLPKRSKCLVFACSVAHAESLTLLLNRLCGEGSAMVVTAHTPRSERAEAIERFRKDRTLRFICNVGVLALGFDAPRADTVCVTRPTASALRYEQMVGRGLRGPKNGGTAVCRVLDVQDEGLPEGIQSYGRVKELWDGRQR